MDAWCSPLLLLNLLYSLLFQISLPLFFLLSLALHPFHQCMLTSLLYTPTHTSRKYLMTVVHVHVHGYTMYMYVPVHACLVYVTTMNMQLYTKHSEFKCIATQHNLLKAATFECCLVHAFVLTSTCICTCMCVYMYIYALRVCNVYMYIHVHCQ